MTLLFAGAMGLGATQLPAQQAGAGKPERIASGDLKKKLDSGEKFLLIDVREDWELKQDGAIAGAIHIPVAELDSRMKDIPKDVQIVFY
jgi:rhodanese-related sulfurtransferase